MEVDDGAAAADVADLRGEIPLGVFDDVARAQELELRAVLHLAVEDHVRSLELLRAPDERLAAREDEADGVALEAARELLHGDADRARVLFRGGLTVALFPGSRR